MSRLFTVTWIIWPGYLIKLQAMLTGAMDKKNHRLNGFLWLYEAMPTIGSSALLIEFNLRFDEIIFLLPSRRGSIHDLTIDVY